MRGNAEVAASTTDFSSLKAQRQSLSSSNGYGAFYFPWIAISNPLGSGRIFVPPSGHVGGVYANNDNNFGVFKAPANEQIRNARPADLAENAPDEQLEGRLVTHEEALEFVKRRWPS